MGCLLLGRVFSHVTSQGPIFALVYYWYANPEWIKGKTRLAHAEIFNTLYIYIYIYANSIEKNLLTCTKR